MSAAYNASTGEMCFSSALLSMKAGGLVRRTTWEPLMWVGLDTSGRFHDLVIRLPNGRKDRWRRPMDDLLSEDWVEALVPYGVEP